MAILLLNASLVMRRALGSLLLVAAAIACQACGQDAASPAATPPPGLASALNRVPIMQSRVTIVVTHDRISINGKAVPLTTIYDEMRSVYSDEQGTESAATVEGTWDAKYGTVLTVCDAAIHAGFLQLGLANRVKGEAIDGNALAGFEKVVTPATSGTWTEVSGPSILAREKNSIAVVVTSDNRIWVEGKRSSDPYHDLRIAIANHRRRGASGHSAHIALMADAEANWGTIVKILDAGRQANDNDVGFVTR